MMTMRMISISEVNQNTYNNIVKIKFKFNFHRTIVAKIYQIYLKIKGRTVARLELLNQTTDLWQRPTAGLIKTANE